MIQKISAALLALLILPVLLLVPVYSDNDAIAVLGEMPSGGSALRRDFDLLYSSTEDGDYTWQAASNGSVTTNPLDSSSQYIYYFGLNSGYVSGIRIYFTILGAFSNLNLIFRGINYSTLGEDPTEDFGISSLSYSLYYYNPDTDSYAYQYCSHGVDAYDEDLKTYDYMFFVQQMPLVTYANNAGSYDYNGYIEFRFAPVDYLGYPNASGGYNGGFSFYFAQSFQENPVFSNITTFIYEVFEDQIDIFKESQADVPVINFVNGVIISNLLASNLPAVLNPFIGVFVSENTHLTFRYLATFCFGMFVLSVLISYLRRAKK